MALSTEELLFLREFSVIELIDQKRIVEDEISRSMFTCDTCLIAPECEWVYHQDNLVKDKMCMAKEMGTL